MPSPIEIKWLDTESDPLLEKKLAEELNISEVTARILINRKIRDRTNADAFLNPSLKWMSSPYLLTEMEKASELVAHAIINKKRIAVYGDYDVDGITGSTLLLSFLQSCGADIDYYIPNRLIEGYGLNKHGIDILRSRGVDLIITVDCGITNHNEINYAQSLGMCVIVTDHHEVPNLPLKADAVVNPKSDKNDFPFKELSGAGVAFYLAIAVRRALVNAGHLKEGDIVLRNYLDLVALGTICDIVPLTNENRIFVKLGLKQINNSERAGIIALKEMSGLKEKVSYGEVAFRLGPRINAGSRLSDGEMGLKLLLEKDLVSARDIASRLSSLNEKRQMMEERIFNEAVETIESSPEYRGRKTLVLYNENWHPGVIGIVASRLVESYYRPVILISLKDGTGKGSGRSIPEVNLIQCLKNCADLLEGFGGHKYAAGLSIKKDKISQFSERFEEEVEMSINKSLLGPKVKVDAEINLKDITFSLCRELELLEPFGPGNPEPNLRLDNLKVIDSRIAGRNHLMLKLTDGERIMEAVGFDMGTKINESLSNINILCYPEINEWNGTKRLRLRIKDIKNV